jgi:hypothetical protein
MTTYAILRFSLNNRPKVIAHGLTLAEAKAHCSQESTHKFGKDGSIEWFDGFTAEGE